MKKVAWVLFLLMLFYFLPIQGFAEESIGVILVAHGGMDQNTEQGLWDASLQQFSYDPNHSVYKFVIWNPQNWGLVLQMGYAPRFLRKYEFEYERIGGVDPFRAITEEQIAAMREHLEKLGKKHRIKFEVDWVYWITGDDISHYPYPRFMYYGPDGPEVGYNCTYCGELEPDGPWAGCNPERYNVDGPAERLIKKGVSRIYLIDITVGGPRFSKTYEAVEMTKRALQQAGYNIPVIWINDYSSLMEESYPAEPAGWTRSLKTPKKDEHILLKGRPNPLVSDPLLIEMNVDGIVASMSKRVTPRETGVILLNHALHDYDEYFDPKIDDTVILNKNIKKRLLERFPSMDKDNIIGAFGGIKEFNPENGLVELSRKMRGETLGYAWLYESNKELPGDEWGYRYWEALEYLKNRGIKHIVIGFPQIVTDSVLNLCEVHNQIGKEIGIKSWLYWKKGDFEHFPGVGHPFADYWGNWANTDCGGVPCCFVLGGCADGRPYPPPRQTPINEEMSDLDPSLAFDLSDWGELGYDPSLGAPDSEKPVQDQYTGTWALWVPPNNDPRMGKMLAEQVIKAITRPMVYLTNGNIESIQAGESVTFEAHLVSGGIPPYKYKWSLRRERGGVWKEVGNDTPYFTWTPQAEDIGTYSIRCQVMDKKSKSGEVIWEGFKVTFK